MSLLDIEPPSAELRRLPSRVVRPLEKSVPLPHIEILPEVRRAHAPRLPDKQIKQLERMQLLLNILRSGNGRRFRSPEIRLLFGGSEASITRYLSEMMLRKMVKRSDREGSYYYYWATDSKENFL